MERPLALHFGAGNIGRGFLGQLYFESGFETVFVDVSEPVIDLLNRDQSYNVRIVGPGAKVVRVEHVCGLLASQTEEVVERFCRARLVSTAVGANVLPKIALLLAQAIHARLIAGGGPVDLLLAENKNHAAEFMREEIKRHLPGDLHEAFHQMVGLVECSIGRMVPVLTEEQKLIDPLGVSVEAYSDLPVDARAFRAEIPSIHGLKPEDNFQAVIERKLFVHNLGHAVAAYLGALKGHTFIWECVEDPKIRPSVMGAMLETARALSLRHGTPLESLAAHANDLLARFANRELRDQVHRVAADPLRKLGRDDRLIGSLLLCLEQGVPCPFVCAGIVAACRYVGSPDDPSALQVSDWYRAGGVSKVLQNCTGLELGSSPVRTVLDSSWAIAF